MIEEFPRMVVLAGPNGSGKSTVTSGLIQAEEFPAVYINADDISRIELTHISDPFARNLEAANLAEARRRSALEAGRAFAFETVLSTPGKLALFDEARANNFSVELIFVTTSDPSINQHRVRLRVAKGGHDVDPIKIAERYERAMRLLPSAVSKADYAEVFDNSSSDGPPVLVALKVGDNLDYDDNGLPWVRMRMVEPFLARAASRDTLNAQLAELAPEASATDASIAFGRLYEGVIVGVTDHHVLQAVDSDRYVLHDRSLCPPDQSFAVGHPTKISYAFGPDGKHAMPAPSAPRPRLRPR